MHRGGIVAGLFGAALLLQGCTAGWVAAGAVIGSGVTYYKAVNSDVGQVLSADAGLKAELCKSYNPAKHSAEFDAKVEAYCANIPTSALGAVKTWIKVIKAKPAPPPAAEPPQTPPPAPGVPGQAEQPAPAPSQVPPIYAALAAAVAVVGGVGYGAYRRIAQPKRT